MTLTRVSILTLTLTIVILSFILFIQSSEAVASCQQISLSCLSTRPLKWVSSSDGSVGSQVPVPEYQYSNHSDSVVNGYINSTFEYCEPITENKEIIYSCMGNDDEERTVCSFKFCKNGRLHIKIIPEEGDIYCSHKEIAYDSSHTTDSSDDVDISTSGLTRECSFDTTEWPNIATALNVVVPIIVIAIILILLIFSIRKYPTFWRNCWNRIGNWICPGTNGSSEESSQQAHDEMEQGGQTGAETTNGLRTNNKRNAKSSSASLFPESSSASLLSEEPRCGSGKECSPAVSPAVVVVQNDTRPSFSTTSDSASHHKGRDERKVPDEKPLLRSSTGDVNVIAYLAYSATQGDRMK